MEASFQIKDYFLVKVYNIEMIMSSKSDKNVRKVT